MGPFLFALALQPILENGYSTNTSVLTPSYLDDAVVLGPKDNAVECYNLLKSRMFDIGLELREEKCEAYSPLGISHWDLPVPVKSDGVIILGTPIGHPSFIESCCKDQVNRAKLFLSQLPKLNDSQSASLLLRYCGVPKISHLLRSVPPIVIDEAAKEFDCALLDTFEGIISCKLSVQERSQFTLGIGQGGFGLTQSSDIASCAFLGAWAHTLHHLPPREAKLVTPSDSFLDITDVHLTPTIPSITGHLQSSLQTVNKLCVPSQILIPSLKDLPKHPVKLQSKLNSHLKDKRFQKFLQDCPSEHEKSRVFSCGGSTAGCWLDAIPSTQALTMSNTEFRVASLLRLGAHLPALRSLDRCNPQCKQPLDNTGYHLLTCKWGGGIIRRHDRIVDCLFQMVTSVGLRCRKELTNQFAGKERPDVAIYDYQDGKKLLLDVTVAHPQAKKYMSKSCSIAGFAAAEREKQKNSKYLSVATDLGYLFRPFSVEVFGRWGKAAEKTLAEVSKSATSILDLSVAEFLHLWRRRFSTCLQKENASIISEKLNSLVGKPNFNPNAHQRDSIRCFGFDFT